MNKPIYYYTVRTYGDGDKAVNIYRIENNHPERIGNIDVAWGHDSEEQVAKFIESKDLPEPLYYVEL